jgi:Flp pilus assembly protein TadG
LQSGRGPACRAPVQRDLYKEHAMKKLKDNKGAALVELALILWFLVLVLFGICEFGWAMYVSNTLNRAAREGARYAAVLTGPITATDTRIESKVKENLTFTFNPDDLTIETTPPTATGDPVKVKVSLLYHTFTGLFPMLDKTTLHSEAAMRYEL